MKKWFFLLTFLLIISLSFVSSDTYPYQIKVVRDEGLNPCISGGTETILTRQYIPYSNKCDMLWIGFLTCYRYSGTERLDYTVTISPTYDYYMGNIIQWKLYYKGPSPWGQQIFKYDNLDSPLGLYNGDTAGNIRDYATAYEYINNSMAKETICDDGIDNDNDCNIDCEDEDCNEVICSSNSFGGPETCQIVYQDPVCAKPDACPISENQLYQAGYDIEFGKKVTCKDGNGYNPDGSLVTDIDKDNHLGDGTLTAEKICQDKGGFSHLGNCYSDINNEKGITPGKCTGENEVFNHAFRMVKKTKVTLSSKAEGDKGCPFPNISLVLTTLANSRIRWQDWIFDDWFASIDLTYNGYKAGLKSTIKELNKNYGLNIKFDEVYKLVCAKEYDLETNQWIGNCIGDITGKIINKERDAIIAQLKDEERRLRAIQNPSEDEKKQLIDITIELKVIENRLKISPKAVIREKLLTVSNLTIDISGEPGSNIGTLTISGDKMTKEMKPISTKITRDKAILLMADLLTDEGMLQKDLDVATQKGTNEPDTRLYYYNSKEGLTKEKIKEIVDKEKNCCKSNPVDKVSKIISAISPEIDVAEIIDMIKQFIA